MMTPPVIPNEPTAIKTWLVSNPVSDTVLQDKLSMPATYLNTLTWTPLAADPNGLTNLATMTNAANILGTPSKNTLFVKATVMSDKAQKKLLQFGYSDKVKLYLNGQIMYQEDRSFHVEDAWFLGTVGFHNGVYLPLKAGSNEILMAITEGMKMNGTGVKAKFADMNGISILNP
jgi:hypothetical protein